MQKFEQTPINKETKKEEVHEEKQLVRLSKEGRMSEISPESNPLPLMVDVRFPSEEVMNNDEITVIASLHGQAADAGFSNDIFTALQEQAIVVAPTTSRKTIFNPEENPNFDAWKTESFKGKNYADEVQDFQDGIDMGLEHIKDFTKGKKIKLVFMGDSLGAAMAADLAGKYSPDQIILLAPSLDLTPLKEEPLIGPDIPQPDQLISNTSKSDVTVIRGTEDPFIPKEMAEQYTKKSGHFIDIEGAGHTFGQIPFLPGDSQNKRKELIKAIKDSLK